MVVLIHHRQHPGVILLKSWQHLLNHLVFENLVGWLNHIVHNRVSSLRWFEHILAQIVELNDTEQTSKVVDNGEDIASCRRDNVENIAQRKVLLNTHEVGLHQLVEVEEYQYRLVLIVGEQFALLTQMFRVDRVGIEVATYGKGDTEVRALDNVDLNIKKGEFVTVIGQSGSGKSTLCKILSGYVTKYEGNVTFDGNISVTLLPL